MELTEHVDDLSGPDADAGNDEQPQDVNPYDFDAQEAADPNPQEIRGIKWRGKDYVLKRASADAVVKFTNARMRCARIVHEQDSPFSTVTPTGGGELPYLLVSMCLFFVQKRADGTESFVPVPEQALRRSWPNHVIDKLYEDAKRISYIDQAKDPHKRLAEINRERTKLLAQIQRQGGRNGNGHTGLVELPAGGGAGDEGLEDPVGNS